MDFKLGDNELQNKHVRLNEAIWQRYYWTERKSMVWVSQQTESVFNKYADDHTQPCGPWIPLVMYSYNNALTQNSLHTWGIDVDNIKENPIDNPLEVAVNHWQQFLTQIIFLLYINHQWQSTKSLRGKSQNIYKK